jgi:hypothetical protein
MSSFAEPTARSSPEVGPEAQYTAPRPESRGTGWIIFSAVLLILAGLLNLVDGLWALDVANTSAISQESEDLLFYANSLETWGWIYTILGAVLVLVGFGLFSRNQWARWIGVGAASASAVTNMMWVFVYPIPALIHVALASMVVYGLTAYGGDDY